MRYSALPCHILAFLGIGWVVHVNTGKLFRVLPLDLPALWSCSQQAGWHCLNTLPSSVQLAKCSKPLQVLQLIRIELVTTLLGVLLDHRLKGVCQNRYYG